MSVRTLFVDLGGDRTGHVLTGHDSLLDATGEVTVGVAVAFVDNALESCALPTHVEITVVHCAGSVAIRKAINGP